ncbi:hypothetical protein DICPUDRAFT_148116 [Dictyostelium purpureum]|uniref:Uncharacterized protein n=1 Tax=Dictyostelium purpureum TaxID=5786 RepID=F0ZAA6_DICPU|nr:uncharacterized protein DICPUDRAFT_148116 [Dictyostelium purpureum]EGC39093.1 hypothetical protein DICPUDRAFT_148116 [Dictyostelium purpureum]|eukprot:XP_003284345.1 hypothetical protein DICPUDRAFT_148116 [Dictyostelium purpureum]
MDENELLEKYKKSLLKGFTQGIAFGIGYGIFSLVWNKYFRIIFVDYFGVPVAKHITN